MCLQSPRVSFRVDRGLPGNIFYSGLNLHFCQSIPPPIFSPFILLNGTARSAHVMRDDLPNLGLGWSCMCAVGRETYLSSDSSSTFSLIVWLFYTTEWGVLKADSSMGPLLIVAMVLNTKWCRLTFAPEKYEESVLSSTWSLQGPYLML